MLWRNVVLPPIVGVILMVIGASYPYSAHAATMYFSGTAIMAGWLLAVTVKLISLSREPPEQMQNAYTNKLVGLGIMLTAAILSGVVQNYLLKIPLVILSYLVVILTLLVNRNIIWQSDRTTKQMIASTINLVLLCIVLVLLLYLHSRGMGLPVIWR
jgi:hypothetical protein